MDYEVKISYCSKELTAREKIIIKDTTNAVSLDTATENGSINIEPDWYAVLDVHNEKSDNKDYTKYIIVATDGTKYITGSNSFYTAFKSIADEMIEAGETDYTISVYQLPSKNFKGKTFITASLV